MKSEGSALEEYAPLLAALEEEKDTNGVKMIRDIMAEEVKHSIMLTALLLKYGVNVEKEGAEEALKFIQEKL
jgi:hypothetical protein